MAIEKKTLEFQGKKIFYRTTGDGPMVVLLHGVPFDGTLWQKQIDTLQGFKFIVPDLPGSGASEIISDMSMQGMAEVVKHIIDTESSRSLLERDANSRSISNSEPRAMMAPTLRDRKGAVLIGHSMGGYISLAFAEKYPEYLRGLGLFHPTAFPDSEERKTTRKKAVETIRNNGAPAFLKTMIPNLFSPQSKEKVAGSIDEFITQANNFSSATLVSYYEAMMLRPDRTAVLKNSEIPMLFIAGKYDNAAPLNDILKQCHLPEKSYFHILEEAGHMGMVEEAQKSNNFLNEYLINLS